MALFNNVEHIPLGTSVNQRIIKSSREEFNELHFSISRKRYDKVVVGAAAIQHIGKDPSILLLKRAAHEVYFPNVFELPSGKIDREDQSIKHALIREVKEETGLDITKINMELEPMIYTTEKTVVNEVGQKTLVSKSAVQLSYLVSVSGDDVKLSEQEHSESIWATKEELDGLEVTDKMKLVIQEAFRRFIQG